MTAIHLDVLHKIAERVPRLLAPDLQHDILNFLLGRTATSINGEHLTADDAAAADCVRRCALEVLAWSDDEEGGDRAPGFVPARDKAADSRGAWKDGAGPIPVAILTTSTGAGGGATEVSHTFATFFDVVVTVSHLVSASLLASEIRSCLGKPSAMSRPAKSHRTEGARQVKAQTVLIAVAVGSTSASSSQDAIRRLINEVIAMQAQSRPWTCAAPVHYAVVITAQHSVDAMRICDSVLSPLRQSLRVHLFAPSSTEVVFSAFLYEALPLFPILLSSEAFLHLRASWDAGNRLSDVLRTFHAILRCVETSHVASADTKVFVVSAPRPGVTIAERIVTLLLEAASNCGTYAARAEAFASLYEALMVKGTLPTAQADSARNRALELWAQHQQNNSRRVGLPPSLSQTDVRVDGAPVIHFPATPVHLDMRLLAAGTTDVPADRGSVGDSSRLLAVLSADDVALDAARWFSFKDLGSLSGLSEARVVRGLFELRSRQLAVVNLAKRQARSCLP